MHRSTPVLRRKDPDSSGDWSIMSERYLILAFQTGAKLWRRVCMPLLSRAGAGCQGRDSDERTRAQFLFSALQRWHSGHSVISTFYLQKRPILKENSQAQHRSLLQKNHTTVLGICPSRQEARILACFSQAQCGRNRMRQRQQL